MPIEPPPSRWALPDQGDIEQAGELVTVGADLEPGTLLAAYRAGLFPMPLPAEFGPVPGGQARLGWWSPDPRGLLPLDGFLASRSLRKSARRFEIRVDHDFEAVMRACGDPARPHGWINEQFVEAYVTLHRLGWAHSVETWNIESGELAGGLYGLAIGGLFAAESKFHWETDASKVAVMGLVQLLEERWFQLLDVQWRTDHLATLGVVDVDRTEYFRRLRSALAADAQSLGPLDEPRRLELFA